MPKSKVSKDEMPYDDSNLDSIIRYAAKLTGNTLNGVFAIDSGIIGGTRTKGYFGQIVESEYFHIDNNSEPVPDFRRVGMELKVTPMKRVKNDLVSKERLVLGIINYNDVPVKGFRIFTDKNSHILMVFYLWEKDVDIYNYRFLKVVDWRPSPEEFRMIREDWDVIEGYILAGKAHLLSERHTKYLAACTKGVGHGCDLRSQPNSDILAKQRALSFKNSFMTSLYHSHSDVNELMIDSGGLGAREDITVVTRIPKVAQTTFEVDDDSETVFKGTWDEHDTFEEYVLHRFDRFVGRSCKEIESMLGLVLSDTSKQYYYMLTLAMMGVTRRKHIKEFLQADIAVKTIRLKRDGRPKESMSFPAFKYEEIVQQSWEDSDFHSQIDHRFFFPVFQFNTSDPRSEGRKELTFKGAFFWSVPDDDFVVIEKVWQDTKQKVIDECFDDFVKASDRRISHVRPHARDSSDTYPYKGRQYVKKCFWFNDLYIKEVVEENLDKGSAVKKNDKP